MHVPLLLSAISAASLVHAFPLEDQQKSYLEKRSSQACNAHDIAVLKDSIKKPYMFCESWLTDKKHTASSIKGLSVKSLTVACSCFIVEEAIAAAEAKATSTKHSSTTTTIKKAATTAKNTVTSTVAKPATKTTTISKKITTSSTKSSISTKKASTTGTKSSISSKKSSTPSKASSKASSNAVVVPTISYASKATSTAIVQTTPTLTTDSAPTATTSTSTSPAATYTGNVVENGDFTNGFDNWEINNTGTSASASIYGSNSSTYRALMEFPAGGESQYWLSAGLLPITTSGNYTMSADLYPNYPNGLASGETIVVEFQHAYGSGWEFPPDIMVDSTYGAGPYSVSFTIAVSADDHAHGDGNVFSFLFQQESSLERAVTMGFDNVVIELAKPASAASSSGYTASSTSGLVVSSTSGLVVSSTSSSVASSTSIASSASTSI